MSSTSLDGASTNHTDWIMSNTRTLTAAEQLVGNTLPNGWTVKKRINSHPNASGGSFSISYLVQSTKGKRAFLKAMDYSKALLSDDPAKKLQEQTAAFNFEKALLEKCNLHKLSRIVKVLDHGVLPARNGDPSSVVQYLVFELAKSDVRSMVSFGKDLDEAWILRALHSVTAALQQLHSVAIAHQDIKPANVLAFQQHQLKEHFKIADLGRASDRDMRSLNDNLIFAGDETYAPLELLYGHFEPDWNTRRLACDLYLLGSLIVYFYTGVSFTQSILQRADSRYHYSHWNGTYRDVLPYLQHAYSQFIRELEEDQWDGQSAPISGLVRELTDLDPTRRGHPRDSRTKNKYALQRYVTKLNLLAFRAECSVNQRIIKRS